MIASGFFFWKYHRQFEEGRQLDIAIGAAIAFSVS